MREPAGKPVAIAAPREAGRGGSDSGSAYVFRKTTAGHLAKTWSLDPRGNWLSTTTNGVTRTRTHNAVNEITDISGDWADPAYDAAGNMVSGPRGDEPAKRLHLVYDAWNRLSKVYDDDGDTAGTHDANDTLRATYRYDGLHRRVRRIVVGCDGNSTPHDIYYNSRWQRLEVRRYGDTAAYEQYLWDVRGACPDSIGIDAPVCRWHDADNDGTFEADANEVHYYTNGANFNVTALLDANSGDVVERYLYDPYGRRTVLNGATDPDTGATQWHPDGDNRSDTDNPLGHQGLPHNEETGFLDNRRRARCPGLGRWLQWDPNGYVDGLSLYEYEGSTPVVTMDPRGLRLRRMVGCSRARAMAIRAAHASVESRLSVLKRIVDARPLAWVIQNWVVPKRRATGGEKKVVEDLYERYQFNLSLVLGQMSRELTSGITVECDCGRFSVCERDDLAYVWWLVGSEINMCPKFFTLPRSEQARVFFHELSHLATSGAVTDRHRFWLKRGAAGLAEAPWDAQYYDWIWRVPSLESHLETTVWEMIWPEEK